MEINVSPLTPAEVERLDGWLFWEEIVLNVGSNFAVRSWGDGYVGVGDVFSTNEEFVNPELQDAFDTYGPPLTACLSVDSVASVLPVEYCAPLDLTASP